ncbi:TOMM precursor leader peptide-binding protein [Actinacidiphila guanduensis]|uniref:Ribosomal protein S12 methylthiotransferase accessory factor n=1 Tax=Actinacidiphila guanduensis TaxID=310781 RepID=A0A1H0K6A8_9ACTN|nr:TOMM precursor leader peptide-binding protein [Actinacidiphila guanduensis]SDO51241.1 ribosomal protein S12 methylthiotransferase accessory factor [Actinacidiphila guanduensis]
MTLQIASRPAAGPAETPPTGIEAAGLDLERRLSARAAAAALPAPAVAVLGARDLLGAAPTPRRAGAAVHLAPDAVLVGPWGGADPLPCGRCLAIRWQRLRTRTEREALETGETVTPVGVWPVLPDHVVDAVLALHSWAFGRAHPQRPDRLARVTRYDLETGRTRTFPLLPEPMCPHHDEPASEAPRFALTERPRPAPDRYRLRRPDGYGLPTDALANPVCGVLGAGTWLDVTSPTTAPVAGTVFMRGYAGLTDVTWSGQANSYAASRDLAFLEGLERYAGTHRRHRGDLRTASYEELTARGEAALDPRACGLYAEQTYRDDPMVTPFDPARPIPWVRGHSLRDDRPVLVPARLAYYSAGTPADDFVFECSNGCAIGSCPEEAILFGLLELVERDAFLLGWYGNAPLPAIDLASCRSPELRAMADRAALCGYDVHVFDNRVDLPVPVATGLAVRRDGGPGTFAFAAGAALDPLTAVESAVSEILTYLPHLPRQVAERPGELAAMAEDFALVRRLPDHAALFGLPRMREHLGSYLEPPATRTFAQTYADWEARRPRGLDLRADVAWLTGELAAAGHDVIVVDQTTPEQRRFGLHTVCTIVPGLLPIDFGWARQRALTMPRLLTAQRRGGLRGRDLDPAEVRRVPHPFP